MRILCTFLGAALCVITVGCASRNVMPVVTQGAELEMFAVALDTLRATQRVPVRVDPRVLGDDTIPYPGRVTVEPSSSNDSLRHARLTLVTTRNLDTVDMLERGSGCAMPGPPLPGQALTWQPQVCLIFARSRPGGAYFPQAGINDRDAGVRLGHRALRVIVLGGSQLRGVDVVMQRTPDGGWRVVHIKTVYNLVS